MMFSSSSVNFHISATHLQNRDAQFNLIQLSYLIHLDVYILLLSSSVIFRISEFSVV